MKKKEIKLGKCIYCNEETDNIELNREIREINVLRDPSRPRVHSTS